ncbi:LA_2272 family surface repeat-containing protein [Sporocytophaga myxococcoides]|uniref:LA_2272 family surface repeat-containing protein n=1 Tax=Sporocytophaga myxococcoides TaxID=153721 RepID=UPI000415EE0B|nr:hypothetical protein [Sporocytophaga myxococcoides]
MKNFFLICILSVTICFSLQANQCWSLKLARKDSFNISSVFGEKEYYLYANCLYNIKFKNREAILGRLIEIKPDTLSFTNAINQNYAKKNSFEFDTITIHTSELEVMELISDRSLGLYNKIHFDNYKFQYIKDSSNCRIESQFIKVYSNDPKIYEVVPYQTSQGIDYLYEENGITYYYWGCISFKPIQKEENKIYKKKKGIWYTPCEVDEVAGVAFGIMTDNIKNIGFDEKDSLIVKGVAIEINPFAMIWLTNFLEKFPHEDSLEYYNNIIANKWETSINGLNISALGSVLEAKINGVNIGGGNTMVNELNGFSISGISNFSYSMKGVCIAAVRNRSTVGKGLQIALVNKCKHYKGVQIGLWNINGKRSLPLINWQ